MSAAPTDQPKQRERREWLSLLAEIGRAHGFFERLGTRHTALYVEEGPTLLVSFDSAERVWSTSPDGMPTGFDAVQKREWSLLNIMASGQSFFRDAAIYSFFDKLVDEDFFERFDHVVFLGCGPMCGYAACAYSVTAPGARVLALNPVATLDRDDASFDMRFPRSRRLNFKNRYGFAPYMLEAAAEATILYDPYDPVGAAHAALYRAPNVQRLPVRWGGGNLQPLFDGNGTLDKVLLEVARGKLTPQRFAQITRKIRRANVGYLTRLMNRAVQKNRPRLVARVAEHGARVTGAQVFKDVMAASKGA